MLVKDKMILFQLDSGALVLSVKHVQRNLKASDKTLAMCNKRWKEVCYKFCDSEE